VTYQLRAETMTTESFDEYDRLLHAPVGEKPKPRSRGTRDLMAAFGMRR